MVFQFTEQEAQVVMDALSELPVKIAYNTMTTMIQQVKSQQQKDPIKNKEVDDDDGREKADNG
jgi:hypothetical protein